METQRLTGLGKRRQIKKASKAMFVWVAFAAMLVSFAIVALQFFAQQWIFNNKVLAAKYKANDNLSKSLRATDDLKSNINALVADPDLALTRNSDTESNLQVILDALPTKADVAATATSIQQEIAQGSGVTLESVTPPTEPDSSDTSVTGAQQLQFSLVASGTYQQIQTFLKNLEKTIRPMNIVSLDVSGDDASLRATITLNTYYQPLTTVTVKKQGVK